MPMPTGLGWLQLDSLPDGSLSPGGIILPFRAGNTHAIGDACWYVDAVGGWNSFSGAGAVADTKKRIGICVGGSKTNGDVPGTAGAVGQPAAATGETALICIFGVCHVVCGSALAVGARIQMGISKKVIALADPQIAAGATPVTSSAANGAIVAVGSFTTGLGFMLEAAGADLDVRLALILPG